MASHKPEIKQQQEEEEQKPEDEPRNPSEAMARLSAQSADNLENIEEEIKATQPLVSERKLISDLVEEFDEETTPQLLIKAKELSSRFSFLRRVRGDGNCFYRALLFAQLEHIYTDEEECKRFSNLLKCWRERLLKLGFPDSTRTICDMIDEMSAKLLTGQATIEEICRAFNNETMSNYYVTFMRLVTSGYLKENKEKYEGFLMDNRRVEEFCANEVDPMFRECSHACIDALTQALDIPVRIEHMDQRAKGIWHQDFVGEAGEPRIHFLYRPGHYDILYKPLPLLGLESLV